ncbi:restriction endonuclease subunit S, partial [Coprobacillus cateniformis]|nr:restriction endonuclease subunit S [Coprobacillus cateniformis]
MMTKENKNPNVPNLRFMGFSEIYITNKLGSLVDSCGGGTPSTKNIDFWNGNIPWISSSD